MKSFFSRGLHRRSLSVVAALFFCTFMTVAAQEPLELDVTKYGVVYRIPGMDRVKVRRDIQYASIGGAPRHFDLYTPPDAKPSELLPVIVFINGIGDFGDNKLKDWAIYTDWGRLAAARGFAAVNFEADGQNVAECIAAVFAFLDQRGRELGVDASRIGTFACSANVTQALPYLMGTPVKGIRAAVIYYGAGQSASIRTDLSVMHVLAGRDGPGLLQAQGRLWERVRAVHAPWTMIEAPTLPHAFDALDYTEESRRVVQQTLAFWESRLKPPPAAPPEIGGREIVESLYANDWRKAEQLLTEAVSKHPNRGDAWAQLGRARQNIGNFAESEKAFLKAVELEPSNAGYFRNLGLLRERMQKYSAAAETLRRSVELGASDGLAFSTLGVCLIFDGKYAEAVENLERAVRLLPGNPNVSYNLACAYARLNDKGKALSALEQAVRFGFNDKQGMLADPDLENLRSEAKFQALADSMGR